MSLQELSAHLTGKGSDKSECLLGALVILFIILIVKLEKCVLGAQKTHLTETVLLSAHNIYFGRKKRKNNFQLRTHIWRPATLDSLQVLEFKKNL